MKSNGDAVQKLDEMASALFARGAPPTPEEIRDLIGMLCQLPIFGGIDEAEVELLARRFEARLGVTMTVGAVLTDQEYRPWLDDARATIDPYYWNRYRQLLVKKGFPPQVVAMTDNVTDRILGLLQNPKLGGPWDRRGMVVGHVQSGKTANYTGLICKAADAGYKLIVVIAGIHNNLRNQTQLRIDEGFVGRDSARLLSQRDERFVGVGQFDRSRRPVTFTNSVKDFNKAMATGVGVPLQNLNEPAVFVIKKNSNTLKNLLEWLREHSAKAGSQTVDAPMLLIDDEADNASINIRHDKGEISRINGQIRDLLNIFERSCYVGYTATPFANIFIDPDTDDDMLGADLFPKHFIVSLDPPSNYFGPQRVFVDGGADIIRYIDDNEDVLPIRQTTETVIRSLPASLVDAVRTFIVARAIRLCRGHEREHCSMLVNASRFTNVQAQLRNEIHDQLKAIQASVRVHGALAPEDAVRNAEIAALRRVWEREFSSLEFDWADVQRELHRAAAPVTVVEVNSRSSGALNYADHRHSGLNVIAVGGFSLSRGLTLEGLMVSYFLRNSMMYDTLMQMGRWFGYRPGYEDLCRIWMPEEAEGWYTHIAESIDLLRDEFRRMEAANATPEEFGLKVRSHPDRLIVTARNKMGTGEKLVVKIGLGNSFVETAILRRDGRALDANRQAAVRLMDRLRKFQPECVAEAELGPGGWLLRNVRAEPLLTFLSEFQNHQGSLLTDGDPIRRYIEERLDAELKHWDILLASRKADGEEPDHRLGFPIYCQHRTAGNRSDRDTLHITNKQRVASRGVEKTGLTADQIREAHRKYEEAIGVAAASGKSLNYPDRIYRYERTRPLFILHLLRIDQNENDPIEHHEPVVAWSISFPRTQREEARVEYIVNTTWLREAYQHEMDDDELSGDAD